jgi:inosose dehydratase
MGLGYTTMMYDAEEIEDALSEIAACRYDGVEIGVEKIRANGFDRVGEWLDEYGLDLYCVMSEWTESDEAVQRMVDDMPMIADLGADHLAILPQQRGRYDDETVEEWLRAVADAAVDAGLSPVLHGHGATVAERPEEIRYYLDSIDGLELLWDTAHYYPYGDNFPEGDLTDGVERFVDDIAYVHLKGIDPVKDFAANRDALTAGDFHLDNVINYFRSFTDLGAGVIDFQGVYDAFEAAGYDGHYTIEIENQSELRLVHAKQNYDYWRDVTGE